MQRPEPAPPPSMRRAGATAGVGDHPQPGTTHPSMRRRQSSGPRSRTPEQRAIGDRDRDRDGGGRRRPGTATRPGRRRGPGRRRAPLPPRRRDRHGDGHRYHHGDETATATGTATTTATRPPRRRDRDRHVDRDRDGDRDRNPGTRAAGIPAAAGSSPPGPEDHAVSRTVRSALSVPTGSAAGRCGARGRDGRRLRGRSRRSAVVATATIAARSTAMAVRRTAT